MKKENTKENVNCAKIINCCTRFVVFIFIFILYTIFIQDQKTFAEEDMKNVLKGNIYQLDFEEYIKNGNYTCEECTFLGIEDIKRKDIKRIVFVDTIEEQADEIWDVSENQDRSVLLWRQPNGNLYDIYIGANGKIRLKNPGFLFYYCIQLDEITFNHAVDTSEATFLGSMFAECRSLEQIDLIDFSTSKATIFNNMFSGSALKSVDLSSFDTANVTNMSSMFSNCVALCNVDVSGFDTANVTNMAYMFSGCAGLQQLSLKNFETNKCENMDRMFYCCKNLTDLDICGFELDALQSMEEMFNSTCYSEVVTVDDLSSFIEKQKGENAGNSDETTAKETATGQPNKKSIEEVAMEVIAGRWGNGIERKEKMEMEGYDYQIVQAKVNEILKTGKSVNSENHSTNEVGNSWTDSDGNIFTVTQIDSKTTGRGMIEFANGDKYEGEVKFSAEQDENGNPLFGADGINGTGTYSYVEDDENERDRYEGEWIDGLKFGNGIFYWTNGSRYEGEWKYGLRNGVGTLYREDGTISYEGEWKDGLINGTGRLYNSDGNLAYEGQISGNTFNGLGKFYADDGSVYEGEWKDGLQHGYGGLYDANGAVLYEGEWLEGQPVLYENETSDDTVWNDTDFEKCIRTGLGYTVNQEIDASELEKAEVLVIKRMTYGDHEGSIGVLILENADEYSVTQDIPLYEELQDVSILSVEDLNKFPNLKVLEISGFDLQNFEPLSGLKNLETLCLNNTGINDLSVISEITNLQYLNLDLTKIMDLSAISGLKNLANLSINFTDINDLSAISELTNLRYLGLTGTKVTDISVVSGFHDLFNLFIGFTDVTDVSPVAGLENLQYLDVAYSKVTDVSCLDSMENLTILGLQ